MGINTLLTISKRKDNSRQSNIELLRIVAMLGVVFLHYTNYDIGHGFSFVADNSLNQIILYIIENLVICAVNLYVLISGYFLCKTQKRALIKVVELICQVVIFNIAFYLISVVLGNTSFSVNVLFRQFIPNNYFVVLYCVLYILSPFINILINNLNMKVFKKMMVILIIVFSIYTIIIDSACNVTGSALKGVSSISIDGSQSGYTIINFILMYTIGAYIRNSEVSFNTQKLIICLIINTVMLFIWSYSEHIFGLNKTVAWYYNNPLVISMAVIEFLLFKNIKINSRIINELARGSFTCFLIHMHLLKYINIMDAVTSSWYYMLLHIIVVLPAIYLISYFVYKIYALCTNGVFRLISKFINKINISINN